ncbi:YHS domain-containing (seleno)protein [uncultured Endozoicomonas sp.]|uniref:YHS domain-containing (seleno)protein n=1 Tax=uncultured Endozoicomonas sp. TaxID=432652 RepID=UPI002620492D|nr:YHS domain-containing (seleno)protein [uncultured Endozoicomonas sp.]
MKIQYEKLPITTLLITSLLLVQAAVVKAEDIIHTGFFSDLAVSGYDTVAYFTENKPVKGRQKFSTYYMGAKWLFNSQNHLDLFIVDPEKYAPQYGGYCAWAVSQGTTASTDPEQWHIVSGKLYLNYDRSVQKKWLANKASFIRQADNNWPSVLD